MEISKRELKDPRLRKFPDKISLIPIGKIHSPFKEIKGIPIQFSMSKSRGYIEIFPKYKPALKDLDGFSHIYCLYYFDLVKLPIPLQSKPFLEDEKRGIFSIRTPFRPNPIGISIFKLIKLEDNCISIENIDVLDNTPVLDIKPYISEFDYVKNVKLGWIKGRIKEKLS